MSDLISRKAAIEAMEQRYCDIERVKKRPVTKGEQAIFLDMRGVIRSLPSWRCRMSDLISRDEAVALVNRAIGGIGDKDAQEYLFDGLRKQMWALPSAEPKTGRDCTDFVRWLMDEVMDEENWQMNAVANGEIICRKLKKLGLLDVVDGYYVETQKTGEWVRHELWDTPWYTCSECDSHGRNDYKFCPNCGAVMRGEDGDTE